MVGLAMSSMWWLHELSKTIKQKQKQKKRFLAFSVSALAGIALLSKGAWFNELLWSRLPELFGPSALAHFAVQWEKKITNRFLDLLHFLTVLQSNGDSRKLHEGL